jgi:hypothetical protein
MNEADKQLSDKMYEARYGRTKEEAEKAPKLAKASTLKKKKKKKRTPEEKAYDHWVETGVYIEPS